MSKDPGTRPPSDIVTVLEVATGKLRETSAKLRSIAYLVENHHDEVGEPRDISDIHWGLGLLLTELSGAVKDVASDLDTHSAGAAHRKTP